MNKKNWVFLKLNNNISNPIKYLQYFFCLIIEIPEIPDLEEQEEPVEDMAFKVAEAPELV
jgi:hypothetical protein